MVSFPIETSGAAPPSAAAVVVVPPPPPPSRLQLLSRDERKERYMAKTRAEASYLFKYLILTQMVVYLEAGAIPCLLDQLSVSLSMTAAQQGALGGVVYLALSAASPLCAFFLHRFNPKHVLGLSLILNNLAVLMLACTPTGFARSADLMIAARALIGFTQAFPCVYTPLWVDEYAPREKVAGWMSYLQGSVPMGVMLGYFIGTVSNWLVPESFQVVETWRWPFVVQFVAMCPIMVAVFFVPKRHVVIRSDGDKSPSGSIAASDSSAMASNTSDVSDENRSIEIAEELLVGGSGPLALRGSPTAKALKTKPSKAAKTNTKAPKSAGYVDPESFFDDDPDAGGDDGDAHTAQLRHTIAGGEAFAAELERMLGRNTPASRSGFLHKEEEDALLASAGMYGGSSQRGLRQLVQNHQNHYSLSEADVGSASFRRALVSTSSSRGGGGPSAATMGNVNGSDLESGEPVGSPRLPVSPIRVSGAAATTYGALESSSFAAARSPNNRSLLDASILEEEFIEVYEQGSFTEGLYELAHIPIFGLIVAGLTAVYFVVTGVQYWSTIFMIKSLHASKYLVNALFVVVAGTGPIFGVFYGGWLIDRYGGYIGVEQRAKSLGICMALGITAFAIAAVTTFFDDIYITAAFLWLLLFFGGSILPACTGIFISVVPAEHRALASSLSVMVFNLFGYSLSPYLTGIMMDWVLSHQGAPGSYFADCDEACAYRLGFRFCLFWSLGSFVCIGSAWKLATREAEDARHVLAFYTTKRSVSSGDV